MRMYAKFLRLLKTPEIQFFIIFAIPFTGFFMINYSGLASEYRPIASALLGGSAVIVFLQTLYGVFAHMRKEKEDQNFMSATAHQLRTPLTAIRWTLQEFGRKELRDDERLELAKISGAAAQKLSNVVDSFDQLARMNVDQSEYSFEQIELVSFVAKVAAESELIARQHGVTVVAQTPREGLDVIADSTKLEIALSNLINNGIKYNRRGGMVTVRVRRLDAEHVAELVVEDTGIGMTSSDQRRLFEKYFRTNAAKAVNPEGSGLGLFLTKAIIEHSRGHLWVESVPGKGTAMHCTLPLAR